MTLTNFPNNSGLSGEAFDGVLLALADDKAASEPSSEKTDPPPDTGVTNDLKNSNTEKTVNNTEVSDTEKKIEITSGVEDTIKVLEEKKKNGDKTVQPTIDYLKQTVNRLDNEIDEELGILPKPKLLGGGTSFFSVMFYDRKGEPKRFNFDLLPAVNPAMGGYSGQNIPGVQPGVHINEKMNQRSIPVPGSTPVFQTLGVKETVIELVGLLMGGESYDVYDNKSTFYSIEKKDEKPQRLPNPYADEKSPVPEPKETKRNVSQLIEFNPFATEGGYGTSLFFRYEVIQPGVPVTIEINASSELVVDRGKTIVQGSKKPVNITVEALITDFDSLTRRYDRNYFYIKAYVLTYPKTKRADPKDGTQRNKQKASNLKPFPKTEAVTEPEEDKGEEEKLEIEPIPEPKNPVYTPPTGPTQFQLTSSEGTVNEVKTISDSTGVLETKAGQKAYIEEFRKTGVYEDKKKADVSFNHNGRLHLVRYDQFTKTVTSYGNNQVKAISSPSGMSKSLVNTRIIDLLSTTGGDPSKISGKTFTDTDSNQYNVTYESSTQTIRVTPKN